MSYNMATNIEFKSSNISDLKCLFTRRQIQCLGLSEMYKYNEQFAKDREMKIFETLMKLY